jgi:hypothetical protein
MDPKDLPAPRHAAASLPRPLLIVVEDVGWWDGHGDRKKNEPFGTGLGRPHVPADYQALIRLATGLGTQIIAGMVLCEWDRKGCLRGCPSSTWLGTAWHGCAVNRDHQRRARDLINDHADHLALALHGLGHEFWDQGRMCRSEFHDEAGLMRDRQTVIAHLERFARLFHEAGFTASFPQVFIPPALHHAFGNGCNGMQGLLADAGIRFVLTAFAKARQHRPPLFPRITEECGVTLIERGQAPVSWEQAAASPRFDFGHPILPLHWANLLHRDPARNSTVVDGWIDFLKTNAADCGMIFLPDVEDALAQIVFQDLTRIEVHETTIVFDLTDVRRVFAPHMDRGFFVTLPDEARVPAGEGRICPAHGIRPGLKRIIPARGITKIHVT